jgi:hypothetical protein
MTRPPLEVADLIRTAGTPFIERNRQWLRWTHIKVLLAIVRCRTAALGGHIDACTRCGYRAAISYNSCRNRHCPKCQTGARERWIQARRRELLPSPYVHVVFTLPPQLASLALQNKKVIYGLLLRASAETLLEVARNPRHLGAEIGFFSVLHTWNQKLQLHPHVHCVIAAGGLSSDGTRWIRSHPRFFLPIQVLRRVFRGKFVAGLKSAFQRKQLHLSGNLACLAQPKIFASWLRPLFRKDWIVYAKPPFGGPEYVLHYLGRYTHRVAISNHRLVAFEDGAVTFRWRDSAHNNEQKLMALSLDEFLRRLGHQLPLALSPVWRPHGDHRAIHCRSDPTSLSTQAVDSCSMKPLSHFENFACPATLAPRVSCHRNIPGFMRLMINATTLQHLPMALSANSLTAPCPPSPSFAHMQSP